MVRVGVGQQDIIDLGRRITGGAQVAQYLPQARAEALRGAGIDQGQMIATLHQVGVDGGLQALAILGYITMVEQPGDGARVDADQLLPAQCDGAIEQCGDLQLPDLLVINARHLLLRRVHGACVGERGAGSQQHGCNGTGHGGDGHRGIPVKAVWPRSLHAARRMNFDSLRMPRDPLAVVAQLLPIAAGSSP
ncbi:hypothetical protein D3C81_569980 [compost metagenome]